MVTGIVFIHIIRPRDFSYTLLAEPFVSLRLRRYRRLRIGHAAWPQLEAQEILLPIGDNAIPVPQHAGD
jgi:hypothetical protein